MGRMERRIGNSSTSFASLFLYRFSGVFSSCLTHAAINLQSPSRIVLYQAPGSSAAVLQSTLMPNSRRSSAPQSVLYFSLPLGPHRPAFSSSPDMTLLGNMWSPMRTSAPDHNNFLVRTVTSIVSHPVRWMVSLEEGTRLLGGLNQAHPLIADGPVAILPVETRIFPSLPGSCLPNGYRDASSALLQLVKW